MSKYAIDGKQVEKLNSSIEDLNNDLTFFEELTKREVDNVSTNKAELQEKLSNIIGEEDLLDKNKVEEAKITLIGKIRSVITLGNLITRMEAMGMNKTEVKSISKFAERLKEEVLDILDLEE